MKLSSRGCKVVSDYASIGFNLGHVSVCKSTRIRTVSVVRMRTRNETFPEVPVGEKEL